MNIDDPKLTAYALGELSEPERLAIEEQLRDAPEARAFVEETTAFAELLGREFHAEIPPSGLDTVQRSAVLDQARDGEKIVRPSLWKWRIVEIAAVLAVIATLASLSIPATTGALRRGKQIRARELNSQTVKSEEVLALNSARYDHPAASLLTPTEPSGTPESLSGNVSLAPSAQPLKASAKPLDAELVTGAKSTDALVALTPPPPPANEAYAMTATAPLPASVPALRLEDKVVGKDVAGAQNTDGSASINGSGVATTITAGGITVAQKAKIASFTGAWKQKRAGGVGRSFAGGAGDASALSKSLADGRSYAKKDAVSEESATVSRRSRMVNVPGGSPVAPEAPSFLDAADKIALRENSVPANTESYAVLEENPFLDVAQNPLSTFSIDVDTASYANVRRFLKSGQRPPVGAVRIEELVNYFTYAYPQPKGDAPFSVNIETAQCPWQPEHRLVRIGLKGREIADSQRPASNLVFLLDVSGSMEDENKLPLLKKSMRMLVEKLGENDKISIVVYAGSTGIALPPTRGDQKERILQALDALKAGGSTNGAGGIQLAYKTATESFIPEGTNRVILATDGDFNVGISSESELVKLIEEQRKSGVFLTVLGFGEGNLKDAMMKKLASHGNGNYAYIDSLKEGRKVLVETMGGTLVTIAKDVKIQVEFNPSKVGTYRLVGYESRMLAKEDFNNDKKDAGEIGAGHTVTALYEIIPAGGKASGSVDPLKYQPEKSAAPSPATAAPVSNELLTVKLRYKKPTEDTSSLIEQPVTDSESAIQQCSPDFMFAAAVAEFGMLLRGSNQAGSATWDTAHDLATESKGRDEGGYRTEFLQLLERAKQLGKTR